MQPNSSESPNVVHWAAVVDIGGTTTKAGLLSSDGRLLNLSRLPTPSTVAEIVDRSVAMIRSCLSSSGPEPLSDVPVGVSIAAFVSSNGEVQDTAHLPKELIGINLGRLFSEEIPTDYRFALDTPTPTLGEFYFGRGRGHRDMAYVTVSTGIGAGLVVDGQYYTGATGWAGGIGHCVVDPYSKRVCPGCGNTGCLETVAATQGIRAAAAEELRRHPDSAMAGFYGGDTSRLTPSDVYQAACDGDTAAEEVFRTAGRWLGIGLTHLANIVAPAMIVVGGGIAQAGDLLLEPAREIVRATAFPAPAREVVIAQAELGDLSGLYGAGAMVFHDLRIN